MTTKKIKSEHSPDGWQIIDAADFDPSQHEEYVEPDAAAEAEAEAKAKADEKAEQERLAKEEAERKAAEEQAKKDAEGKKDEAPVATRKKVS